MPKPSGPTALPPIEVLLDGGGGTAVAERPAPVPPPPPAPTVTPVVPVVDIDALVKAELAGFTFGKSFKDNPEAFFGPVAAALIASGKGATGIEADMKAAYLTTIKCCEWLKDGKADREWALKRAAAKFEAEADAKDGESMTANSEGRKERGRLQGLSQDDPLYVSRLKRSDGLLADAVRLRDESRLARATATKIRSAL